MKYNRLGNAGLRVSAVSLGGWINLGEGKVARDTNRAIVEAAYENGINFFDLADIYAKGEAEKEMGEVLKQYPRHTL
ncbi:MAG: aldo/keto reductase, partial [Aggregatilineales bacterium]